MWLKQYINFNTNKRTNAENLFEKDFFKLMTNSIFGRTMENICKRVTIKLETDEKNLLNIAWNQLMYHDKFLMSIL